MEKILFGKILGEIYRIQNKNGYCPVSESRIYGLLNGMEVAIDEEISYISPVSKEESRKVSDILNKYWKDPSKLESFTGYYDLEDDFDTVGLDRGKVIKILTYFKANRQYIEIIKKIEGGNSPVEFSTLDLDEWDK